MAKFNKSITFEKAQINVEDGTITEYLKDETNVYRIADIMKDWDGIDEITFTIKKTDKLTSPDVDGEDE
jgi:hypothetical protein